jgi:hypothetical protein
MKDTKKKFFTGNFKIKDRGKTKNRWKDVVRRNTSQILGKRGWRRAEDREEWRCLLREARAQKGL